MRKRSEATEIQKTAIWRYCVENEIRGEQDQVGQNVAMWINWRFLYRLTDTKGLSAYSIAHETGRQGQGPQLQSQLAVGPQTLKREIETRHAELSRNTEPSYQ